MNGAQRAEQYCTYEEWLELDGSERTELVDGIIYMMSEPTRRHEAISFEMSRQIGNFLVGKTCQGYSGNLGVKLQKGEDTVFKPDIVVICDPSKLTDKGCEGAPDFVVEILSPSNSGYDKITKFKAYRNAGVMEYWIVDPNDKSVAAYRLIDGKYVAEVYADKDAAPVQTLPGCEIDLSLVFRE